MTIDSTKRREVRAACGAFLLVAFADSNFDGAEEARLLSGLANTKSFQDFDAGLMQSEYNTLVAAFENSYAEASRVVLADVAWAANDDDLVEIIMTSARAAIVADSRLEPQEETAIAMIESALGVEHGAI